MDSIRSKVKYVSLKAVPSLSFHSEHNSWRGLPILQLLGQIFACHLGSSCLSTTGVCTRPHSVCPNTISNWGGTPNTIFNRGVCATLSLIHMHTEHRSWHCGHHEHHTSSGWKQHTLALQPLRVWLCNRLQWACIWLDLNRSATRCIVMQRVQTWLRRNLYSGSVTLMSKVPLQVFGRRAVLASFHQRTSLCRSTSSGSVNTPNFHPYPVLTFLVSLHITAWIQHTISSHCMALHVITSHFRDPVLLFSKYLIQIWVFKTFLSKSIFNTWVFNQHSVICQPPGSYILKCFLRKQSGFVLNSIFNRFQFSDETHLGGVASGFLHLSKISKILESYLDQDSFSRVLVGSKLYFSLPSLPVSEKTF